MRESGDEAKRLAALRRYRLAGSPPDPLVDDLVTLTAALCDAPIAMLGCLERDRVWIKSCHGIDVREFDGGDPLWRALPSGANVEVIPDLAGDAELASHPLVAGDAHWRFAARARIAIDDGTTIALLVVVDTRRRRFAELQRTTLEVHARQIGALFELHRVRGAAGETGTAGSTAGGQEAREIDAAAPAFGGEAREGIDPAPAAAGDGDGTAAIRRRILVVDDVEAAATLLGRVLDAMGHETRIAHDGPRALAIAKEYRPDVVLLDLGMPGMSGFVVARLLRAQTGLEGMKLIAVTGHGRDEDRRAALEAGFDHHLLKPVSAEQMRAVLDELPVPP